MTTKIIARVNNVDIVSTSDEQLVAIKPIREALGIDYKVQWHKIKDDEDFSSTMVLSTTVASDGKEREMLCLPIHYIFGWLFSINPKNIKSEVQEAVREYRRTCCDVLYNHFLKQPMKQLDQNKIEVALLEEIADLNQQSSQLKQTIVEKRKKLKQLREERLKNEPMLF